MELPETAQARLIGGSHAGERMKVRRGQPQLRLISIQNAEFPTEAEVRGDTIEVPYETYRIERLYYGTGHEHVYGIIDGMRLVDAMNVMWNAYQDSTSR